MKRLALLTCFLVIVLVVVPAPAAEPDVTREIINGVTLDPVPEPTKEPTQVITTEPAPKPTAEPTTEKTPEPTTVRTTDPTLPPTPVVTETHERPPTMVTGLIVTTPEPPGPQVGWLTIISTPSGAEVSIDGTAAGVTPVIGREVGAGTHSIGVTMAGYERYSAEKSIGNGEQAAVDATLKEIPVTIVPTSRPTTEPTLVPITPGPGPCLGCDKGWLRVHCNVDGATVSFDDLSAGCTVTGGSCDTEVTTTIMPFRTFTVQKPGYGIFTGTVSRWPAKGETVDLYATLNPVASNGNIQVTSHPSGAIVTLDGGSWQYTPALFTSVNAGSHTLQITMSGYQPYGTSAYVTAGQTAGVNAYLVPTPPQPRTGSLSIATSPRGADIYVDGNYIAESPYVVTSLAPGSHTLRLHKAGYDEYLTTVTILSGQQTPLSFSFTPQQAAVGSIEVASTPAGSALYLDGNYVGQTPLNGYFDLTSVRQGTHTILLRHKDFQDYTKAVYVQGGQVVTLNAQLSPDAPSPIPDTTGQIIVASTPSGAELFLDNNFRGVTPVTLSDIPAGSHVVMARQAGYADASQTVTVTGGQSTPVALGLAEIPVTTKAPLTAIPVMGALAIAGLFLANGRREQ
ncbi:MAG: PEGA domain-containing protein [Methanoregula sp.]|jgi:hypothetical protein|nr:PEGA domain-containing protein [Methanoregula sp.]